MEKSAKRTLFCDHTHTHTHREPLHDKMLLLAKKSFFDFGLLSRENRPFQKSKLKNTLNFECDSAVLQDLLQATNVSFNLFCWLHRLPHIQKSYAIASQRTLMEINDLNGRLDSMLPIKPVISNEFVQTAISLWKIIRFHSKLVR